MITVPTTMTHIWILDDYFYVDIIGLAIYRLLSTTCDDYYSYHDNDVGETYRIEFI